MQRSYPSSGSQDVRPTRSVPGTWGSGAGGGRARLAVRGRCSRRSTGNVASAGTVTEPSGRRIRYALYRSYALLSSPTIEPISGGIPDHVPLGRAQRSGWEAYESPALPLSYSAVDLCSDRQGHQAPMSSKSLAQRSSSTRIPMRSSKGQTPRSNRKLSGLPAWARASRCAWQTSSRSVRKGLERRRRGHWRSARVAPTRPGARSIHTSRGAIRGSQPRAWPHRQAAAGRRGRPR